MSPFQRLRKLVAGAAKRLHLWLLKKSCLEYIDGVAVCDISIAQRHKDGFLSLTRQAMALIKSLDARRYRRVCRYLDYIVNTELISGGNYVREFKICNVDYTKWLTSADPLWNLRTYACLLIHEATHGLLFEKGILYEKETRERVERLCNLEECRFKLHFEPGYPKVYPNTFNEEYYKWYWESSARDKRAALWKRHVEAFRTARSSQPIQSGPKDAKDYHNRGLSYGTEGDYNKAISYFSHAIQLDPTLAASYNSRGYNYYCKCEYDASLADYAKAIHLDPKFAWAYCNRGLTYRRKGEYDKAIADYDKAIQLDPKFAWAYNNRGYAYHWKGEYDSAIADYDKAIQLDPKLTLAYGNRARIYWGMANYGKAIADYYRLIQIDPQSALDHRNLAWLLAICPQADFRDGKKAVENATKACELSEWKDPYAVKTLAAACAEAGDFNNAVKWQSQYLETPNLSSSEAVDAKNRLALYQARKPYHAER